MSTQIDWKRLIGDLIAAGVSQSQIARDTGISQPYINELARGGAPGKDISYSRGQALIARFRKQFGVRAKPPELPEPPPRDPSPALTTAAALAAEMPEQREGV